MNVALVSVGSVGDLLPFLALARALRERGCRTTMLTSARYRALVESDGCLFGSVMDDDSVLSDPRLWHPVSGLRLLVETHVVATAPRVIAALTALRPDLIVANNMIAGAFIAADSLRVPIASVALQPYAVPSAVDTQRFSPYLDPLVKLAGPAGRRLLVGAFTREVNKMLAPLNALRRRSGLPQWADYMGDARFNSGSLIGFWPDWFCATKKDWPAHLRTVGFTSTSNQERPLAADSPVPAFLEHKPIIFAMGSEMSQRLDENVARFRQACARVGRAGLFVSPAIRGHLQVSPDFLVVETAPFSQIFPHAAAVVTHGGIGTLAKVIAAGKPSVVLPMAFDQFDNGHLITGASLGEVAGRDLAASLRRVLSSERIAQALAAVAGRPADGANSATVILLELVY